MNGNRPPNRKTHLLVIGINKYSQQIGELYNARGDAEAVYEVFKTRYGVKDITELYDEKATKSEIDNAFGSLINNASKEDNVVIYYSGHGSDSALFPVDADNNNTGTQLIHETLFGYLSKHIKCHHLLLVVDACYAGSIVDAMVMRSSGSTLKVEELDKEPSRWAIFSAPNNRKAADGKPGEHSPFAKGFLDVLSSLESSITLTDFYNRLRNSVSVCYKRLGMDVVVPKMDKLRLTNNNGEFVFRPLTAANGEILDAMPLHTTINETTKKRFDIAKINCDRTEIMNEFQNALQCSMGSRVQSFFIFDQSLFHTDFVVKRMLIELKEDPVFGRNKVWLRDDLMEHSLLKQDSIRLTENSKVEHLTSGIKRAFYIYLGVDVFSNSLYEWENSLGTKHSFWRQYGVIPIVLKISYPKKAWTNYLHKGFEWFFNEFIKTEPSNNQRFVFFIMLEPKSDENIDMLLEKFLENIPNAMLLPQLSVISEQDIKDWIETNNFVPDGNATEIKRVLNELKAKFPAPAMHKIKKRQTLGWLMGDISRALANFCEEHLTKLHGDI